MYMHLTIVCQHCEFYSFMVEKYIKNLTLTVKHNYNFFLKIVVCFLFLSFHLAFINILYGTYFFHDKKFHLNLKIKNFRILKIY